ncbi:hypothetical protein [Methylobacterium sp. J-077]|uniref:hypothetical protein n=1 Tax=Methylobacterium sp. J-077 TaxID=2836656 RepID=UPI001FBAA539|nr:hypothetical protein [Methylobacterium sp. J-077]MCJ2125861.1 hypothetical protein [Methylobacterium sp. J-077]
MRWLKCSTHSSLRATDLNGQRDPKRRRPAPQFRSDGRRIAAATAAYLKDWNAEPFVFKSGLRVDVAKAIEMHPQAKKLLAQEGATPGLRRTMVMTAVIMGFPVQG